MRANGAYIEKQPVKAGLVGRAEEYVWSRHGEQASRRVSTRQTRVSAPRPALEHSVKRPAGNGPPEPVAWPGPLTTKTPRHQVTPLSSLGLAAHRRAQATPQ